MLSVGWDDFEGNNNFSQYGSEDSESYQIAQRYREHEEDHFHNDDLNQDDFELADLGGFYDLTNDW